MSESLGNFWRLRFGPLSLLSWGLQEGAWVVCLNKLCKVQTPGTKGPQKSFWKQGDGGEAYVSVWRGIRVWKELPILHSQG